MPDKKRKLPPWDLDCYIDPKTSDARDPADNPRISAKYGLSKLSDVDVEDLLSLFNDQDNEAAANQAVRPAPITVQIPTHAGNNFFLRSYCALTAANPFSWRTHRTPDTLRRMNDGSTRALANPVVLERRALPLFNINSRQEEAALTSKNSQKSAHALLSTQKENSAAATVNRDKKAPVRIIPGATLINSSKACASTAVSAHFRSTLGNHKGNTTQATQNTLAGTHGSCFCWHPQRTQKGALRPGPAKYKR
jgi:hypothetical protein